MNRQWVVNASPLISLAKVSQIHLLPMLCDELIIPRGVVQEINFGPQNDPARVWLNSSGNQWIRKVSSISPKILTWDLGLGESQVISWAYQHPGYEVILDDRAARNCANSLDILVRGTIGILLLAKKDGLVNAVTPLFDQLMNNGFRIDSALLKTAIKLASE